MKKILAILLGLNSLILFSNDALAAKRNAAFAGYSFGEDSSYAYLGGVTALNGDIDKNGGLLRVGGGFGKYNYTAPSAPGANIRGQVSSSDLMIGYQQNFKYGLISVYAGGNYDDYGLNKADNVNRVTGGKAGAKGQFELLLNPVKKITIFNINNYTSAYNSYYSKTFIGYNFSKFSFGPEVSFLGNRAYNQQRFGGSVADIDVSIAKLSLSAGYLKSGGLSGDDGAYTTIGLATKF